MGLFQVILGTVSAQLLGMVWYGPPLGDIWARHSGKSGRDFTQVGNTPFIVAIVSRLILALILDNQLSNYLYTIPVCGSSFGQTANAAMMVSVVPALVYLHHVVFHGVKWQTILIDIGYDVVSMIIMCLILCHI